MAESSKTKRVIIKITDGREDKKVPTWLGAVRVAIFTAILFGPGLLADSAAMQWAGFVVLLVLALAVVSAHCQEHLTIEQARNRLDELDKS